MLGRAQALGRGWIHGSVWEADPYALFCFLGF